MKTSGIIKSICCIMLLSNCETEKGPLVIGHRGAMGHETENTLASVQRALELGVDMIEVDVFKIRSGEIVVFHDETLERLSNAGGRIEDYNIFDLRQVVLEGNHGIPMLQDVLKLVDHQVKLNIELKGAGTADRVNFIIGHYIKNKGWKLDDFLISSFNWDELKVMRDKNKEIAIGVLTEADPLDALDTAKSLNAVSINPDFETLTVKNVQKIHDAGFKVYTWTVNETGDLERVKELGVDGIFTNFPERIR